MSSRTGSWVLIAVASVLAVVGLAVTGLLLYSERFSSLVLCTDPEDFACSGHYVYGVPNEVWSIGLTLLGVVLLVIGIVLLRRSTRRPPPTLGPTPSAR